MTQCRQLAALFLLVTWSFKLGHSYRGTADATDIELNVEAESGEEKSCPEKPEKKDLDYVRTRLNHLMANKQYKDDRIDVYQLRDDMNGWEQLKTSALKAAELPTDGMLNKLNIPRKAFYKNQLYQRIERMPLFPHVKELSDETPDETYEKTQVEALLTTIREAILKVAQSMTDTGAGAKSKTDTDAAAASAAYAAARLKRDQIENYLTELYETVQQLE